MSAFRRLGFPYGTAIALKSLGWLALDEGQAVRAEEMFMESLRVAHSVGAGRRALEALEGLGRHAAINGEPERAVRLAGVVSALRESMNDGPATRGEVNRFAVWLALAAEKLSEGAVTEEWTAERAMSIDDAVEFALTSQRSELC